MDVCSVVARAIAGLEASIASLPAPSPETLAAAKAAAAAAASSAAESGIATPEAAQIGSRTGLKLLGGLQGGRELALVGLLPALPVVPGDSSVSEIASRIAVNWALMGKVLNESS
jgi:hypothetical protein